jgi:hypothetical protein
LNTATYFYPLWDHHQGITLKMACSIWYCNIKYLLTTQGLLLVWLLWVDYWKCTAGTKYLPLSWRNCPQWARPFRYRGFTITLRHSRLGRTPLGECSCRRRDLYLKKHDTHKRQTSMPPAGFEPAIPSSERLQTHALGRAGTGIDYENIHLIYVQTRPLGAHCYLPTDPSDETNSRFSFTFYDMRLIRNVTCLLLHINGCPSCSWKYIEM